KAGKPAWVHALWITLLVVGLAGAVTLRFALKQSRQSDADAAALRSSIRDSIRSSLKKAGLGDNSAASKTKSAAADVPAAPPPPKPKASASAGGGERDRVVGNPDEW
ncbi:MAG: hypothetical protein KC503_22525, partial [Myxococcales bacterium]|nr:hypothetical protein [Myxococcales bacterium]